MRRRWWRAFPILARMPTVVAIVGARPNFVKMAPVIDALARRFPMVDQLVVHTGQHYDERMSREMLEDLEFPEPDVFLGVGSGPHGQQTARVIEAVEALLLEAAPDAILVAGDVNSTLGGALAAAKLGIPVVHLEAGLRSFDWEMPEEINRVLTDRLSKLLLTHSPEALSNLRAEGIDPARVMNVGNTMIDSLRRFEPQARARAAWAGLGLDEREYVLVTLHRPSNVDRPEQLSRIVDGLLSMASQAPVLFPVHPRTRERLHATPRLDELEDGAVTLLPPVGYLDFLSLEIGAGAVVTDSGGIQEETTVLGVRCYTLRSNTERPITLTMGTNTLLGEDPARIAAIRPVPGSPAPRHIPGWDGHAGERAAEAIVSHMASSERAIGALE